MGATEAGPARPAAAFTARAGRVASFDEPGGAGEIVDETGLRWRFHCTRIADGSRSIEVDTPVAFRVEPGPTGLEAVAVGQR